MHSEGRASGISHGLHMNVWEGGAQSIPLMGILHLLPTQSFTSSLRPSLGTVGGLVRLGPCFGDRPLLFRNKKE